MKRSFFFGPLPVGDWPASDRAAWDHARRGDPLDDDGAGPAAHWRGTTTDITAIGYGVWLAWLKAKGRLRGDDAPGARANIDNVREYLRDMRFSGLSELSCSVRLTALGSALRVISPATSTTFITRAGGRVAARARRGRSLSEPGRSVEDLLQLGRELIAEAEPAVPPSTEQALAFRDGLLLLLLVHRPLRISNLAAIVVGDHLVPTRGGYRLEFPADQMKSNRRYSCALPTSLVQLLETYLQSFRPYLGIRGPGSSSLWLSLHGKALDRDGLTAILFRRTATAFGAGMRSHLIRHIVATDIAERLPEEIDDVVTAVLGHHELITSERHYNHTTGGRAASLLREAVNARLGRPGAPTRRL